MQEAAIPSTEQERLAVLHALDLLDTPDEAVFDHITRLAAAMLAVPIALVSLVDRDRQWFKSRVGLDVAQTARDIAFCAHAIVQDAPLVVPDALQDPRFRDNPLVTGAPRIRFYAGVKLCSEAGHALGTLCVMDTAPRTLPPAQLAMLEDLAALASREIRLRETARHARDRLAVADREIARNEALFRMLFERAGVGIAMLAPDGHWRQVNAALCEIVGYDHAELMALRFRDITLPDDLDKDRVVLARLIAGEIDRYQLEKRYVRKDGAIVWVQVVVTRQLDEAGRLTGFVSVITDIQARKEAEEAVTRLRRNLEHEVAVQTRELRDANRLLAHTMTQQVQAQQALARREAELRAVIDNAHDAYVCIDQDGIVADWNLQAEATFGWSRAEAVGQPLDLLIIPEPQRKAHRAGMRHYQATGESHVLNQRLELTAMHRSGALLPVEIRIKALLTDEHMLFSAFLHDISARKRLEALREQEARQDALTHLPNRRGFFEILPQALARADRSGRQAALLYIDLDGFKQVNDTFGHEAGDALLREVASRLSGGLREVDTVARLGGDEFVVVLEGLAPGGEDAQRCASKLLDLIRQPVPVGDAEARVSASIGIALHAPGQPRNAGTLLQCADAAMYEAKHGGKDRIVVWPDSA